MDFGRRHVINYFFRGMQPNADSDQIGALTDSVRKLTCETCTLCAGDMAYICRVCMNGRLACNACFSASFICKGCLHERRLAAERQWRANKLQTRINRPVRRDKLAPRVGQLLYDHLAESRRAGNGIPTAESVHDALAAKLSNLELN